MIELCAFAQVDKEGRADAQLRSVSFQGWPRGLILSTSRHSPQVRCIISSRLINLNQADRAGYDGGSSGGQPIHRTSTLTMLPRLVRLWLFSPLALERGLPSPVLLPIQIRLCTVCVCPRLDLALQLELWHRNSSFTRWRWQQTRVTRAPSEQLDCLAV
jgi:hypothetical protein